MVTSYKEKMSLDQDIINYIKHKCSMGDVLAYIALKIRGGINNIIHTNNSHVTFVMIQLHVFWIPMALLTLQGENIQYACACLY